MEDWQKEFWTTLEQLSCEVEQFFQEVGQIIEEFTEQVEGELLTGIEELVETLLASILETETEMAQEDSPRQQPEQESSPPEELPEHYPLQELQELFDEDFFNPKMEATQDNNPACIGCAHYHGRIYGGTLLVCGTHPYGWEDGNCPDWQQI